MAPFIAALLKLGAPLLANAALAKGKDWVKEKTGLDIEAALGTEEGRIKLRQAELEHEEELQKLSFENNKLQVEMEKIFAADRDSARDREVALASSPAPLIGKITTPVLALFITAGFFGVLSYLLHRAGGGLTLADGVKEILLIMLGALGAQWGAVCQYYFGSSAGSAQKTLQLRGDK